MQHNRIEELEQSAQVLQQELQSKEKQYEECLLEVRDQQATEKRAKVKENVLTIKLQKQLADKTHSFTEMEAKFQLLQQDLKSMKTSQEAFLSQVDDLNNQLKEERLKSFNLEKHLQSNVFSERKNEEFLYRINDLEKERDLLKENYDKLYNSAFDVNNSQEQQRKLKEHQLKLQIAQLEAALKSDLSDKNEMLDRMKREKEQTERLEEENRKLQLHVLEQKQRLDEFQSKLHIFTKGSDVDELSEALLLIKARKQQKNKDITFLDTVENDIGKDTERALKELQASYAETVQELEKTRNMLMMQHKINKDYQIEVDMITQKIEGIQKDYEIKLEKYAHALDTRTSRIRKLEAQIKDIAYGTKQYKFTPNITKDDVDELDEIVHLERGENLFEIHISRVAFSSEAAQSFGDQEPATFCTYAFYDFELQTTPVVRGLQPSYDFTSQYRVQVNDFFLQYIQKNTVNLELHVAFGTDYKTVAVCQLRFDELLETSSRIFLASKLNGVDDQIQNYGTLEYWIILRVPMKQAIHLYMERAKALGYISSTLKEPEKNIQDSNVIEPYHQTLEDGSLNELYITIKSCSMVLPKSSLHQPSAYVAYRFFDFNDHCTPVIQNNNCPQFQNCKCFPVLMSTTLDQYLKTEVLLLYVFDDNCTVNEYIGKACVPLLSLAQDKCISGTFELTDSSNQPKGVIDVTLKWKSTYFQPKVYILAGLEMEEVPRDENVPSRLPKEEEKKPFIEPSVFSDSFLPKPKPRLMKATANKKVSFVDTKLESLNPIDQTINENNVKATTVVNISEVTESKSDYGQQKETVNQDKKEKEPQFSEGEIESQSYNSSEDETEVTEDLDRDESDNDGKQTTDGIESTGTDSDDCVIPTEKNLKLPSTKIRIEVVSLSLNVTSDVVRNDTIQRLFVEYKFCNLVTEETPVSLPKPTNGQQIYYNYSNVIHVDKENNQGNRDILRSVLTDPNSISRSVKFTVVSDPPEDEQDSECEDIGFASINLSEILQTRKDIINQSIDIFSSLSGGEIIGKITITVEAAEALRSVMQD